MTSTNDEKMPFPSSAGGKSSADAPSSSRIVSSSNRNNREKYSAKAKERSRRARDHPATTPGAVQVIVPSSKNRLEREKERSSKSKRSFVSASVDMSGGKKLRSLPGAVPSTGRDISSKVSSRSIKSKSPTPRPYWKAYSSGSSATTTRGPRPNREKEIYLAAKNNATAPSANEMESGPVASEVIVGDITTTSELQTNTTSKALRQKNREVEALRQALQRTQEEQPSQPRRRRKIPLWGKVCLGSLILIAAIVAAAVAIAGRGRDDEPAAAEAVSPDSGQTVIDDPTNSVPATPSQSQQPSNILNVTGIPSKSPSLEPTLTAAPTLISTSDGPTTVTPATVPKLEPSSEPSLVPTLSPTSGPTLAPAAGLLITPMPSSLPTPGPTIPPSGLPTPGPTTTPTPDPTDSPSRAPSSSPSQEPSSAPTSKCILLETTLSTRFSPFNGNKAQALNWICSDDTWIPPADVTDEASRSLWEERFALAVYYYATNGDRWINNGGWLTSVSVCNWHRIAGCDRDGSVEKFHLYENRSTGSIPSELWTLTNLQSLSIYGNDLTGTIPSGISALTELTTLSVSNNDLSGSLPDEFGSMAQLTWLAVQGNYLDGTIPSLPSNLTRCRLALEGRKSEGNCFNDTTNALGNCDLSSNQCQLEATLSRFAPFDGNKGLALDWLKADTWEPPTGATDETPLWEERFVLAVYYYATNGASWSNNDGWLTSASVCSWFRISGCNGDGSITKFHLYENRSTGSIPSELWTLTNLQNLKLWGNYLTGTIPSGISALTKLSHLSLSSNDLSGSLPDEFGSMTQLTWLAVQGNYLDGTIPSLPSSLTRCILALEGAGGGRKGEGNCFTGTINAVGSICNLSANCP